MSTISALNQLVVFRLDNELYGIDILKVQEIVSYMKPSPAPNSPEYMKGVINLRGIIIPVIDLRVRFDFPKHDAIESSVIVVVSISDKKYGLIVDAVSDVVTIEQDNIQENMAIHTGIDVKFLNGIAKNGDQMIILVNIEKLFRKDEIETVSAASI